MGISLTQLSCFREIKNQDIFTFILAVLHFLNLLLLCNNYYLMYCIGLWYNVLNFVS